jgi:hypothetical protein
MVGLDVLTEHGNALFEVIDGISFAKYNAVYRDHAVAAQTRYQTRHFSLLYQRMLI